MSRETFIMGFVKAAEDRGVDPVALAKFAAKADGGNAVQPKYKTDGYHPPFFKFKGDASTLPVPRYFGDNELVENTHPGQLNTVGLVNREWHYTRNPTDTAKLRMLFDPRLKAWHGAHSNAVDRIADDIYRSGVTSDVSLDEDLAKLIRKRYDDLMRQMTSPPPDKVTLDPRVSAAEKVRQDAENAYKDILKFDEDQRRKLEAIRPLDLAIRPAARGGDFSKRHPDPARK